MSLISLQEAGKISGLSPASLKRRIKEGILPAVDMRPPWSRRATWRVEESDILALIHRRREDRPATPARATIYQLLQRGKLKAEKFLGRWLIPQDEAERFIQNRKQRLESRP